MTKHQLRRICRWTGMVSMIGINAIAYHTMGIVDPRTWTIFGLSFLLGVSSWTQGTLEGME